MKFKSKVYRIYKTCKPKIIYEFIEAGMTSIYQPPDVVINKPLKDAIKRQYENHRNDIATTFTPGQEIVISRNMLTNFILGAYEEINDENMTNPFIRRSFELCGLNPFVKDNYKLIKHLDSLSLTRVRMRR